MWGREIRAVGSDTKAWWREKQAACVRSLFPPWEKPLPKGRRRPQRLIPHGWGTLMLFPQSTTYHQHAPWKKHVHFV